MFVRAVKVLMEIPGKKVLMFPQKSFSIEENFARFIVELNPYDYLERKLFVSATP